MKPCLILTFLCILSGCAHVKHIGTVGGTAYYSVASPGLIKPSLNIVVAQSLKDTNDVKVVTAAQGPGIGNAIAGAGGNVASALIWRDAFQNNGVSVVNQGSTATADSNASATGGTRNNGGPHTQIKFPKQIK